MSTTNHGAGIPAPSPLSRGIADAATAVGEMERAFARMLADGHRVDTPGGRVEFYAGTPDNPGPLLATYTPEPFVRPVGALNSLERAAYFGRETVTDRREREEREARAALVPRKDDPRAWQEWTDALIDIKCAADNARQPWVDDDDVRELRAAFIRVGALLGYDVKAGR